MTEVTIAIPTPLRVYTENQKKVRVDAQDVESALTTLVSTYPTLKKHLYDGDILLDFVNVYLNEEDIRYAETLELKEGDKISIVPSIAGGVS